MDNQHLSELNDEQLLDKYDDVRAKMSYYNAAEGRSWYEEKTDRLRCRTELSDVKVELDKRNLQGRPGQYLI